MRIAYIVPGSGGTYYCENCFRDIMTIHGLRKAGHEVIMVPLYLPMIEDYHDRGLRSPIFFGAINIYLKQFYPLYRTVPHWAEKVFDSPFLLYLAAKQSGSTEAANLEEMTISMLQGEQGNQADELEVLVEWLVHKGKPDLVHLSNALLIGLAGRIKTRLGVPIVCSLQDEHTWIDTMDEPYAGRIWQIIAEKAAHVELFLPVSHYYASYIREKTSIPPEKMQVVYVGVNPEDYRTSLTALPGKDEMIIGYLGRINQALGIDTLVRAFMALKQKSQFQGARLRITGGRTGDDKKKIRLLKQKLSEKGLLKDVEFVPRFDLAARTAFLHSLTLLAVPAKDELACGLASIEAQAAGIPVIAPARGALAEVIEKTGGGILYNPQAKGSLEQTLALALNDRERLDRIAALGREGAAGLFNLSRLSGDLGAIYSSLRGR